MLFFIVYCVNAFHIIVYAVRWKCAESAIAGTCDGRHMRSWMCVSCNCVSFCFASTRCVSFPFVSPLCLFSPSVAFRFVPCRRDVETTKETNKEQNPQTPKKRCCVIHAMCLVRHLPVQTTAKQTSYVKRILHGFTILAPVALRSYSVYLKKFAQYLQIPYQQWLMWRPQLDWWYAGIVPVFGVRHTVSLTWRYGRVVSRVF